MRDDLTWQKELATLCAQLNVGTLSPSQRNRLTEILKDYPEALDVYLDQIEMEAMLSCIYGQLHQDLPVPPGECDSPPEAPNTNDAAKALLVPMIAANILIWIGFVSGVVSSSSRISAGATSTQCKTAFSSEPNRLGQHP